MISEAIQDLLLAKSAITNYPILAEQGWILNKPLLVIVNQQDVKFLTDMLLGPNGQVLSQHATMKEIENALQSANSSAVVCVCNWNFKYEAHLLQALTEQYRVSVLNKVNVALPVILSVGYPKCRNPEDYFVISLTDLTLDVTQEMADKVVPPDITLQNVFSKIREILANTVTNSPEHVALIAAACCLFPNLSLENRTAEFQMILKRAEDLIELNEQNQELQGLGTLTIKEVFRWGKIQEFSRVFELPNLEMSVSSTLETSIFYDAEFIYFKDALFKQAVSGLLHLVSYDALKAGLATEEILCSDSGATYTSKMTYVTIAGEYARVRMLKFKREAFQGTFGGDDFIEQCMRYRRFEK